MANPTNTNTKHKQICRAVLPICKQTVRATNGWRIPY